MDARKQRELDFHSARFGGDDAARQATEKYYRVAQPAVDDYHDRIRARCRGARLLEYGCGTGSDSLLWDREGAAVTGIDISPEGIEKARRAAQENGRPLRFEVMDAEALSFPDGTFDLVVGTSILHHLDLGRAFAELARVCAPDGRAIFFEPLGHNPVINLYRRLTPSMRTPDEHPLRMADLALAREYFADVRARHFVIFALLAAPLHRWPALLRPAQALLGSLDRALMALFPVLRRYSWIVVLELGRPRKAPAMQAALPADQSL